MIARLWRGRTRECQRGEYFDYVKETGIEACRKTDGNRGVFVLRRVENGVAEFLFLSLWDGFDAIGRFAGGDLERAVYYPEDEKYLLELDPRVTHYEVLFGPDS